MSHEKSNRKNGQTTGRGKDGRFARGNSGRPKGARHKATVAALELLEGEAEAITRKLVEVALSGDTAALKLVLERIAPPRKDVPISFDLPHVTSAAGASEAMAEILAAVASGDLTPGEGSAVAALIEQYRKTYETAELEVRIVALEDASARRT